MARVFLGIGSNKGDRLAYLQSAVYEIARLHRTSVRRISSVYETEPVGLKEQPEFLNAAIEIETSLGPNDLLHSVKELETKLGRMDQVRWGPREIDIDLLYFDDRVINEEKLQVPHSEAVNRRFVLIPLAEIAEDYVDPSRKLGVADLIKFCKDTSSVRKTKFNLSLEMLEAS